MESGGVIFLRWIKYEDLLKQYLEGTYRDNTFNKIKFEIHIDDFIKEKYGTDPNQNRFTIRSANGCEVVVHTTNVNAFNGTLNVNNAPLCGWCRTNLAIACPNRRPFPVITQRDIETNIHRYFDPAQGKIVNKITTKPIYSGDILCCDGECAVTVAMQPEYLGTNTEMYIRTLYRYMYPEGPQLKRAKPFKFLKHNGGDMSYEEYKRSSNSEFRELTGSIVAPNKRFIIEI